MSCSNLSLRTLFVKAAFSKHIQSDNKLIVLNFEKRMLHAISHGAF